MLKYLSCAKLPLKWFKRFKHVFDFSSWIQSQSICSFEMKQKQPRFLRALRVMTLLRSQAFAGKLDPQEFVSVRGCCGCSIKKFTIVFLIWTSHRILFSSFATALSSTVAVIIEQIKRGPLAITYQRAIYRAEFLLIYIIILRQRLKIQTLKRSRNFDCECWSEWQNLPKNENTMPSSKNTKEQRKSSKQSMTVTWK